MSFENLALRACTFTGAGTLLAVLANTALGARENLLLASVLGAAIGSCIGWIILQHKLLSMDRRSAAAAGSVVVRRSAGRKAAP
jgi:hypothetical protein